jgi:hypothetical protein
MPEMLRSPWYWIANVINPVQFSTAFGSMTSMRELQRTDGKIVFIEIGPHPVLNIPIQQIMPHYGNSSAEYFALLRVGKPAMKTIKDTIASLKSLGIVVDISPMSPRDTKKSGPEPAFILNFCPPQESRGLESGFAHSKGNDQIARRVLEQTEVGEDLVDALNPCKTEWTDCSPLLIRARTEQIITANPELGTEVINTDSRVLEQEVTIIGEQDPPAELVDRLAAMCPDLSITVTRDSPATPGASDKSAIFICLHEFWQPFLGAMDAKKLKELQGLIAKANGRSSASHILQA